MKKAKSLEQSGLLIKDISGTIKNQAKEQKDGFLGKFWGKLGVSFLGSILEVKE